LVIHFIFISSQREAYAHLHAHLEKLSPIQREAVRLRFVNGQAGKIISSYASAVPTASTGNTNSLGQTLFSRQRPASEGYGYRSTAWSPDGRLMASALSSGIAGEIQVWNPQTDATNSTLTVGSYENIGALSWSSDGQHIAAST
jgi:WD40 repeat protein